MNYLPPKKYLRPTTVTTNQLPSIHTAGSNYKHFYMAVQGEWHGERRESDRQTQNDCTHLWDRGGGGDGEGTTMTVRVGNDHWTRTECRMEEK